MKTDRPGEAVLAGWGARETWALLGILLFATVLRLVFYTGYFGSDEVTYAESALKAVRGEPLRDIYIGAIRLGVNYPMAAFVNVFGVSEASLAAWGFVCSVLEIGLVFLFAFAVGGLSLATVSATILALVPMHVHSAGRILADAPLALFVTGTMVLFYFGERTQRASFFVAAGLCAGAVFWVKQAVVVFLLVFVLWAIVERRIDRKWWLAFAACLGVVALNFLETWRASGNLWLYFDSMAMAREHLAKFVLNRNPWAYWDYLLVDVRYSSLVGWLAVAGGAVAIRRMTRHEKDAPGLLYTLVWAVGLIAVFSFFVASVNPFELIPKQANYMAIFLAPLAVLGGIALLAIPSRGFAIAVFVAFAGLSIVLAGLQQQSIRSFVSGSVAASEYAVRNPEQTYYVMTNAYRYQHWRSLLGAKDASGNLRPLEELVPMSPEARRVIVDEQTLGWSGSDPAALSDLPTCWRRSELLQPMMATTAGSVITDLVGYVGSGLPARVANAVRAVLSPLRQPKPASVMEIPAGCSASIESGSLENRTTELDTGGTTK